MVKRIAPTRLTRVGGILYFRGGDADEAEEARIAGSLGGQEELWRSDGTARGTWMVRDIRRGIRLSSFPRDLTNVGGTLYFSALDNSHGRELWKVTRACAGRPVRIVGTPRRDVIRATRRADVIWAGNGNDVVKGLRGDDRICLGKGRDRAYGGAGADRLYGGPGRDRLYGGAGRDLLAGNAGPDRCFGGSGRDVRRARGCEIRRSIP